MTVSRRTRNLGAAIVGNALEWFDILIYAYFVKAIATNFFPTADDASSLVLAYGTFGLSFVARPLGALVLGRIADRGGRRTALVYATALMFVGTAAIAVLPAYNAIGMAAPLLLLVARLVQGFSVGGEFGSAAAYLAEQAAGRRAFYSSLQFASQGVGMVTAALVALAVSEVVSASDVANWGWRIPFLVGAALGPLAFVIRRGADETDAFLRTKVGGAASEPFRAGPFVGRCAIGAAAVLACNVSIYFLVYIPTFAQTWLRAAPSIAYTTAIASGLTLLAGAPLAGLIADRFGPRRTGMIAAAALIVLAYPVFAMMIAADSEAAILVGQIVLSAATALYVGPLPAILAELFDTRSRSLGLSISYNVAVMTGGGFAQMIFVLLIGRTGSLAAPSFYVVLAAAISLAALRTCRSSGQLDRVGSCA